ncbi:MAG: polymerase sigma-70 factor, subfamily [Mycobacterium sp.]|jgi:hypothetical protein|nr:polymerase sigma-70 factor, subfamily [Mycobacterium sp.]
MDWFDRKIVEYVLLWAPYGRLHDEDVFPEFGMGAYQLYERFSRITSTMASRAAYLDDLDRALVDRARHLPSAGPRPRQMT